MYVVGKLNVVSTLQAIFGKEKNMIQNIDSVKMAME